MPSTWIMHEINDHKTELKKAAEEYPLRTNLEDWDFLQAMINVPGEANLTSVHVVQSKSKRNSHSTLRMFLGLILILLWKSIVDVNITSHHALHRSSAGSNYSTVTPKHPVKDAEVRNPKVLLGLEEKNVKININNNRGPRGRSAFVKGDREMTAVKSIPKKYLAHDRKNIPPAVPSPTSIAQLIPRQLPRSAFPFTLGSNPNPIVSRKRSLYIGIGGGMDASMISNQAPKKPGLNVELIVGKYLSNRASLETGILFGNSYYYTAGKYFSMAKVGPAMPQGIQIMDVNGKFNALHFPLKLKYDAIKTSKHHLFITGGFLSTLLLQENNDYMLMYNNQMMPDKGMYRKNYFTLLSDMSISVGFEKMIEDNLYLRVEPYYSVPLKKTGMGEMHVHHTGARVIILYSRKN